MARDPSKFAFYERVRVTDASLLARSPAAAEGHVAGMNCNDAGAWAYAIMGSDGIVYDFEEAALESLGSFVDRNDVTSGDTVRVAVDGQGWGRIVP